MTSPAFNVVPEDLSGEENSVEKNDVHTDELRRALQTGLSYGSAAWLAQESGVCISTTRKAIEGECRLPASLVRSALRLRSPEDQAALLSLWLGIDLVAGAPVR